MRTPRPLPPSRPRESFRARDAIAAGVSARRLRASDLEIPFRGVRSYAAQTLGLPGRCRALALRLPPDAVFSHETAARILGIPLPLDLENAPELVVTVPARRRAIRAAGVRGHSRTLHPSELVTTMGITATGPERTWCDLGASLDLRRLVAAGDFLVAAAAPQTTVPALAAAAAAWKGRAAAARLRDAARLLHPRSESPAESVLRVMLMQAGFPRMDVNVELYDNAGRFVARPDIRFPDFGVIVEYEGDDHRTSRKQWKRDLTRTAVLFDGDEHVMRIGADQLDNEPDFLTMLRRLLVKRGWRPDCRGADRSLRAAPSAL